MQTKRSRLIRLAAGGACVAAIPVLLAAVSLRGGGNWALASSLVVMLALVPFFLAFENRRPQAREIVMIAVMVASAVAGRVVFAATPNFKPVTAIVVVTGAAFGPGAGFMTGALAALLSNFFFGQGTWTPWQMFAWGIAGLLAGAFARTGLFRHRAALCVFGAFAAYLYGLLTDVSFVLFNGQNLTPGAFFAAAAASFPFDTVHAASTVIFLFILAKPLLKNLQRLKIKYGIMQNGE